jgi:hypothetical protein
MPTPAPPRAASQPTPPPRFESEWTTEQEWLVDCITRDIREMAAYAATGSLPVDASLPVKPDAIHFEDHLFSPLAYETIAREALGASAAPEVPSPSRDREDDRLLEALLDLGPNVLVREDEALSRRLGTEPRDAGAHERAALLLGAFAMRENAGRYSDARPALCRMTAQLAFARALRAGASPGLAGRLAEALLVTHLGRERDALDRLDALEATAGSRAERAWVRALRLRNTRDWRIAKEAKTLTLLEKREEFRAMAKGLGDTEAFTWLEQAPAEPIPDWGLIALNAGFSVETGNRFAPASPMWAMAEAGEVWAAMGREPLDPDDFLERLNERAGRLVERDAAGDVRPAVLGWGLWADRAQRHLLFGLVTASYHLGGQLGLPGQKQAYVERIRGQFSRLEMFAMFLRNVAVDVEQYRPAMAAVRELALRSPERLTGGCWVLIRDEEKYAPVPQDLPDEKTWFVPALVPGTLLDVGYRLDLLPELEALGPERLRALGVLAPYNIGLAYAAASRQPGDQRTVAHWAPIYGPLAEFNVLAMGKLADAAWYDPVEYRRRQGALCELHPEKCFLLGYRLDEMGFPDEAAVAYQKGFDRARDRVAASHESDWLVEYYFDRGDVVKAEAVARDAAGTGSGSGLFVMAMLRERQGRLDEAEDYYRRLFERYDNSRMLTGFYYRQARVAGNAAYETKLRDTLALALPEGLEPFDRSALPPEPIDGVVVRKENDNTKRYGIKWGHVIVGLDGFRTRNLEAYYVVRSLSHDRRMKLVVWRGTSYDDIEVELRDRRFRVTLEDLAPKEKD